MNPFGNESYRSQPDVGSAANPFGEAEGEPLEQGGTLNAGSPSPSPWQPTLSLRGSPGKISSVTTTGANTPIARLSFSEGMANSDSKGRSSRSIRQTRHNDDAAFGENSSSADNETQDKLDRSSSMSRSFLQQQSSTLGTPSLREPGRGDSSLALSPADALVSQDSHLVQELGMKWQPNEDATNCWCCDKGFGIVRRKHHCRMCGHVVCWDCSSQKMIVPGFPTKQRVCKKCSSSWIEKLVVARQTVQQLKVELGQSELKVGELNFQRQRLQQKNSELMNSLDQVKTELSKEKSVNETLHAQLEEKTMHIMKLKKSASLTAKKDKKNKKSKDKSKDSAAGATDSRIDPNWKPAIGGSSEGTDFVTDAYAPYDSDDVGPAPKSGPVDQPCKCAIS